mgnify:CR=1 FL=1
MTTQRKKMKRRSPLRWSSHWMPHRRDEHARGVAGAGDGRTDDPQNGPAGVKVARVGAKLSCDALSECGVVEAKDGTLAMVCGPPKFNARAVSLLKVTPPLPPPSTLRPCWI